MCEAVWWLGGMLEVVEIGVLGRSGHLKKKRRAVDV